MEQLEAEIKEALHERDKTANEKQTVEQKQLLVKHEKRIKQLQEELRRVREQALEAKKAHAEKIKYEQVNARLQ